jgi:hypothetical protein
MTAIVRCVSGFGDATISATVQAVDGPRLGLIPTLTEDGRVDPAVIETTTDSSSGAESTRELDGRFLKLVERVRFDFGRSWIAVTWQDVHARKVPEGAAGANPCRQYAPETQRSRRITMGSPSEPCGLAGWPSARRISRTTPRSAKRGLSTRSGRPAEPPVRPDSPSTSVNSMPALSGLESLSTTLRARGPAGVPGRPDEDAGAGAERGLGTAPKKSRASCV